MTSHLRVNGARLWHSLMDMAKIGATPRGGVCRLALSEEDKTGRDLFRSWCEAAGCTVSVDRMGNMFARRPGQKAGQPPIAMGSHLDSQPTGGKFDGVYGVLAGLEVIRTLNDNAVETQAPVEVVVWTNEEGARFAPAMVGSGVFAGVFDLEYAWAQKDRNGVSISEALDAIGYKGHTTPGDHMLAASFEVHIEQGPILEAQSKTIGIVTGVQGMRWYDVALIGEEAHAGPTPMEQRRDALTGAAALLPGIYQLALERAPFGRATVAQFRTHPSGSRNTVPSRAEFSVDLRHPDAAQLGAMDRGLRALTAAVAAEHGLESSITDVWSATPVNFDSSCIDAVRKSAEVLSYPAMEIVSGAGHDSVYISRVAPTGMIFVPCEGGISHNEMESATPEHVAAGANVLLHAVLQHTERTP